MNDILDQHLTLRVGALDPPATEKIEDYASAAFMWRHFTEVDALDLARGLQWLALGHTGDCAAPRMIAVLAWHPLPDTECARLGALLDVAYHTGEKRQRALYPPDRSTAWKSSGCFDGASRSHSSTNNSSRT